MKKIVMILFFISSLLLADFKKNSNQKIVIDNNTKLIWQDNLDAKTIKKTWDEAKNYCEDLTLADSSKWRLPTIDELKTILDLSKKKLVINDNFSNTASSVYWSSTLNESNPNLAWNINFFNGKISYFYKTGSRFVRCVRDEK